MVNFLKKIGKGLLYIFVLPGYLIVMAGVCLYSLGGMIAMFIKSIFLFFSGRSLYEDLPEDIKAREIINQNTPSLQEETSSKPDASQMLFTTPIIINNEPNQDKEEDTIVKEKEENITPSTNGVAEQKDNNINAEAETKDIAFSQPVSNNMSIKNERDSVDEIIDNSDSGVDIKY